MPRDQYTIRVANSDDLALLLVIERAAAAQFRCVGNLVHPACFLGGWESFSGARAGKQTVLAGTHPSS